MKASEMFAARKAAKKEQAEKNTHGITSATNVPTATNWQILP